MPDPEGAGVEAELRARYAAQCAAMVSGDADALGDELASAFTLTHMTGYVQSRREWVDQVRSGEMTYHAIDNVSVTVEGVDSGSPVLTARSWTDATIWGGRGHWPLQLKIQFTRDDGRWVAAYTIASTW